MSESETSELHEIVHTLDALRSELEDVAVGGLRTFAPERLPVLRSHIEELERIGASHLAERLSDLALAVEQDDKRSAASLMRAQASLRLFERVLTLRVAKERLAAMIDETDEPGEASEEAP